MHGNSVIMQGVIDTGMAQTSCFLIPIDIGNIAQLPGNSEVETVCKIFVLIHYVLMRIVLIINQILVNVFS